MAQVPTRRREEIWQPWYDTLNVPATVGVSGFTWRLFQSTTGQGGSTFLDTNNQVAGQLPAGYKLKIYSIRLVPRLDVAPVPATDFIDFSLWLNNTFLEFNTINKNAIRLPCKNFTAGAGIALGGGNGAASGQLMYSNGVPDPRAAYTLKPQQIIVNEQEPFTVVITQSRAFAAAVTTAFSVTCYLDGTLERPIQ